jgi:hypothetical protein
MHAYPAQLADYVLDHWPSEIELGLGRRALMDVLSSCFQASLDSEEGRPVRFRLIAGGVRQLSALVTPDHFLPLEFCEPLPLTPDGLRRLSPAAPFHSSLIGAALTESGWSIWGVVHTGPEWLAPTWGGRDRHQNLSLPIIHVTGAGRLGVYASGELIATLERGMIEGTTTDVFNSAWLPLLFRGTRQRLTHDVPDARHVPDDALVRVISQHMVRRAIFLIRQGSYGGLVLLAEPELLEGDRVAIPGLLKLKYSFRESDARARYRTLLRRLVELLAENGDEGPIDLARFLHDDNPAVDRLEQAIFEVSRLIAGLAAVDGAVVLTKRFDLIGFGAEVSGELPYPDVVWQALDVEAEKREPEAANSVGTRHRAAYRFVTAHPSGLAIVVSHDGVVRIVANVGGDVVYWEQFLNW